MLQPSNITPEDYGEELAAIIPGKDPELSVSIKRIPVSQLDLSSRIIPVCEPTLSGNEAKYVLDCLESNWISSAGKYIPVFEEQFAAGVETVFLVTENGHRSISRVPVDVFIC